MREKMSGETFLRAYWGLRYDFFTFRKNNFSIRRSMLNWIFPYIIIFTPNVFNTIIFHICNIIKTNMYCHRLSTMVKYLPKNSLGHPSPPSTPPLIFKIAAEVYLSKWPPLTAMHLSALVLMFLTTFSSISGSKAATSLLILVSSWSRVVGRGQYTLDFK